MNKTLADNKILREKLEFLRKNKNSIDENYSVLLKEVQ